MGRHCPADAKETEQIRGKPARARERERGPAELSEALLSAG